MTEVSVDFCRPIPSIEDEIRSLGLTFKNAQDRIAVLKSAKAISFLMDEGVLSHAAAEKCWSKMRKRLAYQTRRIVQETV